MAYLCTTEGDNMYTDQLPNTGPRPSRLRVLTLNLWQRFGAWSDRRTVLIDRVRALNPDLVAFQESIKTDEYDQTSDLLGSEFNVVHGKTRDTNGMGVSLASRWPFRDVQEVEMNVTPRTAGFPCTTLVAGLVAPDPVGPLLFVNHFPSWQLDFEHERELQAVAAARFLEERRKRGNEQVVMVGDLDADPSAASIRFWCGRQSLDGLSVCYRDAWESAHPGDPGHTFTPTNPLVRDGTVKGQQPFRDWPFRRIDYIFLRFGSHGGRALDVAACSRIFDEPLNGIWASDHFGLVADFVTPAIGARP
jgi:endonuclease/exonuclease/phosphatase family metal-dependent hydrolase